MLYSQRVLIREDRRVSSNLSLYLSCSILSSMFLANLRLKTLWEEYKSMFEKYLVAQTLPRLASRPLSMTSEILQG